MVDGFTDEKGKFRPIDRSALPKSLSVRELLPKQEKEEEKERQRERLGKFALKRAKEFGKGAKITGRLLKAGGEALKQKGIERSIAEQEKREDLEKMIDDILDEVGASDSRKFRRLQRFAILQRNRLSKSDLRLVNDTLRELDVRIQRSRKGERKETGGMTQQQIVGIPRPTEEQFEKLPEPLKEQVRLQVGG